MLNVLEFKKSQIEKNKLWMTQNFAFGEWILTSGLVGNIPDTYYYSTMG